MPNDLAKYQIPLNMVAPAGLLYKMTQCGVTDTAYIKQHVGNWKMQCFQSQGTEEKCIFDGCLLKNLAVCEMSFWPFAVLENGLYVWILALALIG